MINTIPDIRTASSLSGKRVLLRADFNVPIEGMKVASDARIRDVFPTLRFLMKNGARVILMSHIGRNKEESLRPVYEYLRQELPIHFIEETVGPNVEQAVNALPSGSALLLENLRREEGEAQNDAAFAHSLALLGDLYVNEAFPVSHRSHASIVGVPALLPHYAGIQFLKEVEGLSGALKPTRPSLFLLGGAKFETKEPLIEKFLGIYDEVFVGGALANDFLKAKGYEVGRSLLSDEMPLQGLLLRQNLLLPIDVEVETEAGEKETRSLNEVLPTDSIFDIGPETVHFLRQKIEAASFILWNGPLGVYERGFQEHTEELARLIASSSAHSVIGGGDTVAATEGLTLEGSFSFVSTAGGAMLDFLLEGTLPGIKALQR